MEIDRYAKSEPFRQKVEALCCFRGVKGLTAMTILTELGDIKRFAKPTGLMAYAGLVPSERGSGKARHRLQKTYWKIATRKHPCAAVTVVARELCGSIWSALWALESQEG